ncbi:right-handed parallel beta-helix repeat-containing protein, partial [Bartonella sp. LB28NMGDW]|uniref:right-handed parallel beta-helix repeat-containing protein n=1 Tax=Bartonella sp. LB28NMGDW TaxID=3243549 RepID=UPI0035CF45F2
MYKKSLLSYTATVAIILSSIYSNAHAESLEASGEGHAITGETGKAYEILHAKESGKITGENLTVTGNKDTNKGANKGSSEGGVSPPPGSSSLESPAAVTAEGKDSIITLTGNKTTIKGTDSAIIVGVEAKDGGTISITGGSINASDFGAIFLNSNSDKNKLENVTISSDDDKTPLGFGAGAENSTVTLKDVIIKQTNNAVSAKGGSTITITGGSFASKAATIVASQNSKVTINDSTITSSDDSGLLINESGSISMTGGSINASYAGASFSNSNSDKNKLKNVTISSNEDGKQITFGVTVKENSTVTLEDVTVKKAGNAILANNSSKVKVTGGSFASKEATIAALKNSDITIEGAQITSSNDTGLWAQEGGSISMNGGSIKSSYAGASFSRSKNENNKLKNVEISSNKEGELLIIGVEAKDKSLVTLDNVKVTQAKNAIISDNNSTITVSGGSFVSKQATIFAQNGGTITINDSKITSSDNTGLWAKDNSTIKMTKGKVKGGIYAALTAENGGHINVTDVSLSVATGGGAGANASGPDSMIELHGTEIDHAFLGLYAEKNAIIKMTGGTITTSTVGATFYDSKSNENKLEDVTISSSQKGETVVFTGLNSQASNVTLKNVHITNAKFGVYAMDHSKITISGGSFVGNDIGINAESGSTIALTDDAKITSSNGYGLHASGLDSTITMTQGNITGKEAALAVENGGHIDTTNIFATAERNGIKFENPEEDTTSEINLTNAKLHIKNGIGINVDESTGTVNLGKKSEIRADVLLVTKASAEENGLAFTLNSDNSILEGRAKVINSPKTIFNLQNNTQWIVKTSTNEKDDDGNLLDIAQRSRSDISTLNLNNSTIVFNGPTEEHYHTLHIGSGKPDTQEVYNATGDAKIYFNIAWSDGAAINDQKTDRLLIHGDVSGSTTVYIKSDTGDESSVINASDPSNIGGLSLIQVSGEAKEDSFKLVNGYTTRGRLPYKYTLTAYGPESSHGQADVAQNLFDEKNENFWDFRLHKEILETDSGSGPSVIAPVAQTASYLVMPNALFYTGLTDIAKQNALLATMRTSVLGKEEEKQTGFFLYTYGSTGTLSSERGPLKYGYGADIRYAALQAGVTLAAIEGQNTTTHFGLVGTYGRLSFTPKEMQDA